jgi:nucleoside-diphosphate-sugar epimerase
MRSPTPLPPQETSLAGRRILVTGGGGFFGSHLCERLVARGADVGVLARTPGMLQDLAARQACEFLACDLNDAERAIDAIVRFRPEFVVHLASRPDGREDFAQAQAATQVNVAGTLNALEGTLRAGGALFVYGDSTKVYGNSEVPYRESTPAAPNSSYAVGKLAGWHLCELYASLHGLNVCSVRPTMTYGPRQRFNLFSFVAQSVQRGDPEVRLDGGNQTRDPLYVGDAVDAFVAILGNGARASGRIINIGGGVEYSVAELAHHAVRVLGGRQRVVCVPGQTRPTEIWRSYCDNAEAQSILGWTPRTDLPDGLAATFASMGVDVPVTVH